jgi:hypothetical protein
MLKSTAKEGEPANGENTFTVGLFQNVKKAFKFLGTYKIIRLIIRYEGQVGKA